MTKTRFRSWQAPSSLAARTVHSASNPRPASDPRTVPIARTSLRSCHWHRATARLRAPMTRAVRAAQFLARCLSPLAMAMLCSLPSQISRRAAASRLASAARCPAVGSSPRAVSRPRTFSMRTSCGRSSAIARLTWCQIPDLVPCRRPARAPAADTSWHGNPAHSTSTGSICDQSTAVMSPRFGTPGKRCARIFDAPLSLSATQASSPPVTAWTAMPRPS